MDEQITDVSKTLTAQKNGFLEFIREQGIIGLAVGFILGGASAKLVSSFTDDIINPLLGVVIGNVESLSSWVIKIGDSEVGVGNFLYSIIDFLVILFVVYFAVKILHLDRLDKKKPDKK